MLIRDIIPPKRGRKKFSYKVIAVFLIILIVTGIFPTKNVKEGVAASWLGNWAYRKSHVINATAGAGTNYQIKITVHYGIGVDGGEDVYLNNHSRTDFGDVRFTDNDSTTLLDYWMEEKVDGDYAIFWVKVIDDLSVIDRTIYVYYGKSDATIISNGANTFYFFSDFETGDLSEWSNPGADCSIETGIVRHGSYAAKCNNGFPGGQSLVEELTPSGSLTGTFMFEGYFRGNKPWGFCGWCGYPYTLWTLSVQMVYSMMFHEDAISYYQGVAIDPWPLNFNYSGDTWHRLKLMVDFINSKQKGWRDNDYMGEIDLRDSGGNLLDSDDSIWRLQTSAGWGDIYVDMYFVRKYTEPEPSHGSWGAETMFSLPNTSLPVSTNCLGNIYHTLGGEVSCQLDSGNQLKVIVPPNSIEGLAILKIEPKSKESIIQTNPLLPDTQIIEDLVSDFTVFTQQNQEINTFNQELTLIFTYNPEKLKELEINESSLTIYKFNNTKSTWQQLRTTIDSVNHIASAKTRSFSIFALIRKNEIEEKPTVEGSSKQIIDIQEKIVDLYNQIIEKETLNKIIEVLNKLIQLHNQLFEILKG